MFFAYALWRASHHSRSPMAGASAAMHAMPDEFMHIVKHKPGLFDGQMMQLDGTLEELAEARGFDVEELRALNAGAAEGDFIKLPKESYRCTVVGVKYNFMQTPKSIGPFLGEVVEVIHRKETRHYVISNDTLKFHTPGEIHPAGVGIIPPVEFKEELRGISAPPVGKYIITLNKLEGSDRYMGTFAPL